MIKVKSRLVRSKVEKGHYDMKTSVKIFAGGTEMIFHEVAAIFDALRTKYDADKVDAFIRSVLLEEDGKDDKDRNCKGNCKSGGEGCCTSESDRDCEGGEK